MHNENKIEMMIMRVVLFCLATRLSWPFDIGIATRMTVHTYPILFLKIALLHTKPFFYIFRILSHTLPFIPNFSSDASNRPVVSPPVYNVSVKFEIRRLFSQLHEAWKKFDPLMTALSRVNKQLDILLKAAPT